MPKKLNSIRKVVLMISIADNPATAIAKGVSSIQASLGMSL